MWPNMIVNFEDAANLAGILIFVQIFRAESSSPYSEKWIMYVS